MRISLTLSRYIGRQFLFSTGLVLGVMLALAFLMDTVELLRRASGKEAVTMQIIMELALLKLPDMLQQVLPFAVLIGGILMLSRLTRSHELIVARAAGVSVWQFLLPVIAVAALVGLFVISAYSPFAATLLSKYEQMEAKYLTGRASLLAVSSSGLWLRQVDNGETGMPRGETIVHALRASQRDMDLFDVIIFRFDVSGRFLERLDAKEARLGEGYWELHDVLLTSPSSMPRHETQYRLPTSLTVGQIQDSFSSPKTMSVWQLAGFIHTLEEAGFSALRHRLYLHSMLAMPLFLAALVFISAGFALRPHRMGGTGMLLSLGVFTGFIIYFLSDVIRAMGLSGTLPVPLAAWSPTLLALLAGVALLLHLEDG